MKIGIDKIGFYAPHLYVDMNDLAEARGVEPAKFTVGIGQDEMAIAPLTQDPVTLAANAAKQVISEEDKKDIDLVLFCTESGIDHSKSAAVYVHELLGLNPETRAVELKQACYSATAGLQMAKGHIALHPEKKVLVLASDIARYGLNTSGEVTQGAGAIAMVVANEPRILSFENESTYMTKDIMDFWRPVYSDTAYVDGKFSNEQYIHFFQEVWHAYKEKSGKSIEDFAAICYHLPYTKMGLKALRTILEEGSTEVGETLQSNFQDSITYSRRVGNIYTASLYLGLLSLLENGQLNDGDRIGLYSYGSGAVGEFFTGVLEKNYKNHLNTDMHKAMFDDRRKVSVAEYEEVFSSSLPVDGSKLELETNNDPAAIKLIGIDEHKRQYL